MRHSSNAEDVSDVELPGSAEAAEIRAKAQLRKTPDGYAQSKLGMKLHPKQAAVLRDIFKPRSRVSLRKANEVGGTRKIAAADHPAGIGHHGRGSYQHRRQVASSPNATRAGAQIVQPSLSDVGLPRRLNQNQGR